MKPKLILTDEIKASLDYENTEYLMDLLFDLNKENGLTVITSTHCSYTKKMDYFYSVRKMKV
ncbi:protein of unknown function [Weissella viridescens]|nr:hypothetical protein BMS97_11140 [Leuconostoc mesenteroides subsp. mesenteroides]SOB44637.1 protein of unknown function [Weissella viridescens]